MDSLNSWLGTQLPSLFWLLIIAGIFFLLVVLCMYAWRVISRPHVRNTAGRNRQPRLGVLDSYSVDRVRQLVLVRRDNVEHLIMIGGPNDLVVESGITRGRPMPVRPVTPPIPERAPGFNAAPRQVEEDFVRPADTGPFSASRTEIEQEPESLPAHEPVAAAPAPVAPAPAAPVPAPPTPSENASALVAAVANERQPVPSFLQREPEQIFPRDPSVGNPPVLQSPAVDPASAARRSVIPPRGPGFFQRATSRFPNFGRQTRPTPAAPEAEIQPTATAPEAGIPGLDTQHFEELLTQRTLPAATPDAEPAEPLHVATETHEELFEEQLFEQEPNEFEPTEDEREPEAPEPQFPLFQPASTRLPEIRLPDLKIPGWRRPVVEYPSSAEPRTSFELRPEPRTSFDARPEPATSFDVRPEPRFSSEPRQPPEIRQAPEQRQAPDPHPDSQLEPLLSTGNAPVRRSNGGEQAPTAPPAQARPESFRVGDRLTTPTRPAASPAAVRPAPTAPPPQPPAPQAPEPEDPFASLEEEMANLLGRGRDTTKP